MILNIKLDHQSIARLDCNQVVADSRNYLEAAFSFSEDWEGTHKTVIFGCQGNAVSVILNKNDTCQVPPEVIQAPEFTISVFGGDRITSNLVRIPVSPSGLMEGQPPEPPTPDAYNQILTELDGKANLADIPTKVSELENDAGFTNGEDVNTQIAVGLEGKADRADIPTRVSQLENDSGYTTQEYVDNHIPVIGLATQEQDGLMSAGDKTKLDGMSGDAPIATQTTLGTVKGGGLVSVDAEGNMGIPPGINEGAVAIRSQIEDVFWGMAYDGKLFLGVMDGIRCSGDGELWGHLYWSSNSYSNIYYCNGAYIAFYGYPFSSNKGYLLSFDKYNWVDKKLDKALWKGAFNGEQLFAIGKGSNYIFATDELMNLKELNISGIDGGIISIAAGKDKLVLVANDAETNTDHLYEFSGKVDGSGPIVFEDMHLNDNAQFVAVRWIEKDNIFIAVDSENKIYLSLINSWQPYSAITFPADEEVADIYSFDDIVVFFTFNPEGLNGHIYLYRLDIMSGFQFLFKVDTPPVLMDEIGFVPCYGNGMLLVSTFFMDTEMPGMIHIGLPNYLGYEDTVAKAFDNSANKIDGVKNTMINQDLKLLECQGEATRANIISPGGMKLLGPGALAEANTEGLAFSGDITIAANSITLQAESFSLQTPSASPLRISNVAYPGRPNDTATMEYVDDRIRDSIYVPEVATRYETGLVRSNGLVTVDESGDMDILGNPAMPTQEKWNSYKLGYNARYVNDVQYANGILVIATDGLGLAYSEDWGVTVTVSNETTSTWKQVIYVEEKNLFVAVGPKGVAWGSDGKTWTRASNGPTGDYPRITYGNGKFVCLFGQQLYTSIDADVWTETNVGGTNRLYRDIKFLNGKFLAFTRTGGHMVTSSDTEVWEELQSEDLYYDEIVYGNGRYIAAVRDQENYVYQSTDLLSWRKTYLGVEYTAGDENVTLLWHEPTQMFVIAASQGYYCINTPDCETFYYYKEFGGGGSLTELKYTNDRVYTTGRSFITNILYSFNRERTLSYRELLNKVAELEQLIKAAR